MPKQIEVGTEALVAIIRASRENRKEPVDSAWVARIRARILAKGIVESVHHASLYLRGVHAGDPCHATQVIKEQIIKLGKAIDAYHA